MQILRYVDPFDVGRRLHELGLDESMLRMAIGRGHLARLDCTDNHPRIYPAIAAWAETVCALRENLSGRGWERRDDNNFPRVINASGDLAIIVATGNELTGLTHALPSTRASKGRHTVEAVVVNEAQLNLFAELDDSDHAANHEIERDDLITYVLLFYRDVTETRCELSLPSEMGADGRITNWRERIILRPIPNDDIEYLIGNDDGSPKGPPVEVPVRRKQ